MRRYPGPRVLVLATAAVLMSWGRATAGGTARRPASTGLLSSVQPTSWSLGGLNVVRTEYEKTAKIATAATDVGDTLLVHVHSENVGPLVLVVEDDPEIAALMRDYLEADGFRVNIAPDAEQASEALRMAPDCVLLDVMLPGRSGFELCREIRAVSDMPVLFLSARGGDADKIRGLGLGADDYIVKSASAAEVIARVKAVLRRSGARRGLSRLRFGRLEVDLAAHEVTVADRPVRMTAREFELLRDLVQHPRQVFSREHLFELVWGSYGDRSAVSVYISRLREKIEDDPTDPRYIVTVWGAGYRFDDHVAGEMAK